MSTERVIRGAAALLIVVLFVSYAVFRFPSRKDDTATLLDFSEFYAAGQIVRQGLGGSLYDLKVQSEFQLRVAPVHAFYLRPPFEALLFVPFSYLTYRQAYVAWVLFSLLLLFLAAKLIQTNTNVLGALRQYTRGIPADFGLMFVVFLTFAPTMNCFLIGQDSILMLVVYTGAFVALKRRREVLAGGLLACGLVKFHLVLPFVIIFALRRRIAFLAGFAATALVLVAISMLVCGPAIILSYPKMFLNSQYRALMGFQPEYAANIRGLVYLAAGARIPAAISVTIVAILSVLLLWATSRIWSDSEFELSFSAAVIATLLTGVHAFVYDLSLLLLPVAIVCGELAKRATLLRSRAFNFVLILLFIPPFHHLLITSHVYALMALLLFALYVGVERTISRPSMQTESS